MEGNPVAEVYRLPNGSTPQQQREDNRRYRQRQREARLWLDDVARGLGVEKRDLVSQDAALVAGILKNHFDN